MSEWVIFVQHQVTTYLFISWRAQVTFQCDDDDGFFVLEQHAKFDFYCAKSLSTGRHVDPLGHNNLIPANQSFVFDP